MKESVNIERFVARFDECGRSNNFSLSARYALFDHIEQMEEDIGSDIEFDVVALCCDYTELESLEDFADSQFSGIRQAASELGLEIAMSGEEFEADDEEIAEAIREYIHHNGELIEFEGGIIVSSF